MALTLPAAAFEGRINIALAQGAQTTAFRYTFGPDHLRIEVTGTNWPNPIDIVERQSGALVLVFPHNRSFVRLKPDSENVSAGMRGFPGMRMPPGGLPPGIGPRAGVTPGASGMPVPSGMSSAPAIPAGPPPGVGPQPNPAMPTPPGTGAMMPTMPRMSMPGMMNQKMELAATGKTTNLVGFGCQQYELKQRGQTLEVWATDQLPGYHAYIGSQPHSAGPRTLEDQWPAWLAEKKLFPMIASLRYDSGAESMRLEVTSVSAEKIVEPDEKLFQPPPEYHEMQPLPF
jgi:hypothetical protein